jgi:uncharacterized protein YyaL (SSP411 family)
MKISIIFLIVVMLFSDSEYIKEHSHDLVKWHKWNKKSFIEAKKENKLIFVTIGYSTCHWCHVMMKESFRNKKIASYLNKYFYPIVVDKEENTDIDRYFQWVFKKMYHKSGGWPINIIMTPDKKILYISNYIPPNDIFSKKGFLTILPYFAKLNKNEINKIIAKNLKKINKKNKIINLSFNNLKKEIIKKFDFTYGGFKGLHKFPEYSKNLLLLDVYLLSKNKKFSKMLNLTLTNMAKSGMYDQIEGGFFRYSVYDDYSIPHFEKMLYTNALMVELYSKTYKYFPKKLYKKVIVETINEFYNKYFDKKTGLFYAANSADSPNEGDYFCFSKKEILGAIKNFPNKKEILEYINFDQEGNFEKNKNHIYFQLNNPKKIKNLEKFIKNLKQIRKKHKFPFIDKKKILSWNAMMASALFNASIINKKYTKKAEKLLNSIERNFKNNNEYYHSFVKKKEQKANLEDFSYLMKAYIDAYEFTFKRQYLIKALDLYKKIKKFKKNNQWYLSTNFIATIDEKSYPSALSILFNNLINIADLQNDLTLYEKILAELKEYPLTLEFANMSIAKLKTKFSQYIIKTQNPKFYLPLFYPFYLWKKTDYNYYQICNIFSCIKRSKNIGEIDKFFKTIKY